MASVTMRTVADLITGELPLFWHEAVALVQEIARVSAGQPIPGAEDLLVDEDGTISFAFASENAGPPVVALARLLTALLRDDAPAPLKDFAGENAREQPSHPTVESFTRALAFFERPGRAGHLLAVAARVQNAPRATAVNADEELARLRERVVDSPADKSPVTAVVLRRSIQPRYLVFGAVAAVVFVALATLGFRTTGKANGGAPPPAADSVTAERAPEGSPTAASADAVSRSDTKAIRTGDGRANKDRPASAGRHRRGDGALEPLPRLAPLPAGIPDGAGGRTNADRSAATSGTTAKAHSAAPVNNVSTIYTNADAAVTPAVFLRPQMPSAPSTARPAGYFDLTVDQEGNVENVRLISPASRYQERLLVSAAKAWRFRPALLDGRPVKYRMRIPITVPVQQ